MVVGAVGALVAVGGHVVGGGDAVTPAVAAALLLVVAGTVVASARRWTLPRLLVALAAAQPAVHGVLWLSSPSGTSDPRLSAAGLSQHAAHGHAALDGRMLLAHALAVGSAALLLGALEACALSLWALVTAGRLVTARITVPAPLRLPVAAADGVDGLGGPVVGAWRSRRGPPEALAPC